ncbi:Transcriptional regulator MntR [bioreactor metagenome]|uniref:Transcriptional regulator MntR n=1 Tax=bioreactor metagenome TaxID=1076179 RepID=A0A644YI22_9ZZZZ
MEKNEFYTFREYAKNFKSNLTPCEEDYVEMIYRLSISNNGYTRVNDLAAALNVKPPSVTKMIKKLNNKDLIAYEKYGIIQLLDKGKITGKILLDSHNTIEKFMKMLDISEDILEETEKIEHTISVETLVKIKELVDFFTENREALEMYKRFKARL